MISGISINAAPLTIAGVGLLAAAADAWFKAMGVVERCERTMFNLDQLVRPAS